MRRTNTWTLRISGGSLASLLLTPFFIASGQVRLTKDEALKLYFPDAVVERKTAFLTDAQMTEIQKSTRTKVSSQLLTYYVALKDGQIIGTAIFETQTVRTMPTTYAVIIDPDTTIRAVELLAMYEPEDYAPSKRWLEQFTRKRPTDDLWLKRGIQNISGASLTAQTISDGVRRMLASYVIMIAPKVGM